MRTVFGIHNALAALRYRKQEVQSVLINEGRRDKRIQQIEKLASEHSVPVTRIPKQELNELAGTNKHQGVVLKYESASDNAPQKLSDWFNDLDDSSLIVVLDSVIDPRNLGACIRSAHAFGAGGVIVNKSRASPMTDAVSSTAAGAAEITPVFQASNLARTLEALKELGLWVIGLDPDASDEIYTVGLANSCALVFGAEGRGLRMETKKKCDMLASIPMLGEIQSVNVSVAVGIAAYETVRQRSEMESDGQ